MPKDRISQDQKKELLATARGMLDHAYAPYSNFRVGAAVLTQSGEIFGGCNVENASYGLTNCAERSAIFAAVGKLGPNLEILAVVVTNAQDVPCSPCGACRQVIFEFGPGAIVIFQSNDGWTESPITELLPHGFRLK